ncbi:helix-turn-helix domain-containing protein [Pontibacter locisalis]|uniref:Helix-turn-helix domain-containing protein n=1 Tax=Pontibacter locisalis TaxID=1719035 RepID=A0ABW5IPW6_9BACT
MVDRIRQLMEFKELSSSQFADTVDVPRAVISHIISGRNKPSLDVIIKIISAFPEVNKDWMLMGEGNMLSGLVKKTDSEMDPNTAFVAKNVEPVPKEEKPVDTEKVQEPSNSSLPIPAVESPGKKIEQIVIFYSDKSFVAYKP